MRAQVKKIWRPLQGICCINHKYSYMMGTLLVRLHDTCY